MVLDENDDEIRVVVETSRKKRRKKLDPGLFFFRYIDEKRGLFQTSHTQD